MVEWSRAFGGILIYLHSTDAKWVMRPDPSIQYWSGNTLTLGDGLTLVRVGGHFEGSTALHWAAGAGGQGALLSGDMPQVVSDRVVQSDAQAAVTRSAERYLKAIES
jgi:glyoxylase-like metal-dependent hydrolase (beta-lactamase superfamily II)